MIGRSVIIPVLLGLAGGAVLPVPLGAEVVIALGHGPGNETRLEQEVRDDQVVLTIVVRGGGGETRTTVATIKDGLPKFAAGHAGPLVLLWEHTGNICPAGVYRIVNLRTGVLTPVALKGGCDPVAWSVLDRDNVSVFIFDQGKGRTLRLTVTQ